MVCVGERWLGGAYLIGVLKESAAKRKMRVDWIFIADVWIDEDGVLK